MNFVLIEKNFFRKKMSVTDVAQKSKKQKTSATNVDAVAAQKIMFLENIVAALTNSKISNETIFSMAEKCLSLGMTEQYEQLIKHAATAKNNLKAAFIYVSMELEKDNIEFLQQHCLRADASPYCLTLLVQLMESSEHGLDFDIDAAAVLLNRAIERASALATVEDVTNRKYWQLALLRARYERIRYMFDFKIDQKPGLSPLENAQLELAAITKEDRELKAIGATFDDLYDIHMLRGRIADASGGPKDLALAQYRHSISLARKTNAAVDFLNARVAALTPNALEAKKLMPNAIKWLDDLGVGENDKEMPDLVRRYASMVESGDLTVSADVATLIVGRVSKLTGKRTERSDSTNTAALEPTTAVPQIEIGEPMPQTSIANVSTATTTNVVSNNSVATNADTAVVNVTFIAPTTSVTNTVALTTATVSNPCLKQSIGGMTEEDWNLLPPLASDSMSKSSSTFVPKMFTLCFSPKRSDY